jgi:hypothetical protein
MQQKEGNMPLYDEDIKAWKEKRATKMVKGAEKGERDAEMKGLWAGFVGWVCGLGLWAVY